MNKLFRPVTFQWWQVSVFKISMAAFGVALGAYFAEFFLQYLTAVIVVFLVTAAYISYVWLKQ